MTTPELLAHAAELRAGRTPFVLATVVRTQRPTSAKPGDCALVLPDGTLEGFVGGTCAESTVRTQSLRLLRSGESTLLRITPGSVGEEWSEGLVTVPNPCLSGGALDIFLEAVIPPLLVRVLGDAPIAKALVRLGTALGHEIDDSPDAAAPLRADTGAVVIAAHGRDETPLLLTALRADVPYIGLVASRRRGAAVLAALDVSEVDRARIHTPAGLDIGARTPTEIALSVYAEILADRPRVATPQPRTDMESGEAIDPVCGMAVAITPGTARLALGGTTHYFCGPGCRQAFAADPAAYPRDADE